VRGAARHAAPGLEHGAGQRGPRASAADERHSRLELAPDRDLPDWYTEHDRAGRDDIHLVAGGYWRDELVGPVYERGGAVYRLAWRDGYGGKPGALEAFARSVPPGNYRRVLDLGCSFGALTRALRAVFTDAEVTGIDLSAPALTYAHQLAAQQRQDITYAQRDAAATGYADASFDLIGAFLLLHEVPDDVRTAIVAEAFRLLRPGGRLIFLDIPPYRALEPVEAFFQSFDGRGNGENFWESFLVSDFPAVLAAAGFTDVTERALDFTDSGYWGSAALWRTGQFRAVHRWVTTARRPGPADEAGGRP
jgi:SAM-dependent methyltransferase